MRNRRTAAKVSWKQTSAFSTPYEKPPPQSYGWWGYRAAAMLGLTIGAWSQLPVEAVGVWLAVSFTTVIGYEVVKIWLATGKRALEAFFGVQRP
jgi:hypothetical protein